MRTEEFRDFDNRVSTINRNFSHSVFLSEQFLIDNTETIRSNPEGLSGKLYASNPYSKHFNYKLGAVSEVIEDYKRTSFIGTYILIYSTFESYTESLFTLVKAITNKRWNRPNDKSTLEAIYLYLNSDVANHLDRGQNEINTLDYIRLRRNSLIHADGKPSHKLAKLIKDNGQALDSYWQGELGKVNSADLFSSMQIDRFRFWEIIDIMRIVRAMAKKIDGQVLTLLKKEDIIAYILRDFQETFAKDIKRKSKVRLQNMFAAVAKRKFDIDEKDIDFTNLNF